MRALGMCGFCGVPLSSDGSRRWRCRPASNLEEAVMRAAAIGRAHDGSVLAASSREARTDVEA